MYKVRSPEICGLHCCIKEQATTSKLFQHSLLFSFISCYVLATHTNNPMALLQPVLLNTSTPHFTHKPRSPILTKKPNPSVSILQPHHNQQLKSKFLSICAVVAETAGGVSVEGDKSDDQDVVLDINEGLGSVKDVVEYDWTQEWYPLYLTKNIPDDSPLGLTVFDKQVVLYKDGNGELQCYEDRCPHRYSSIFLL